MSDQISETLARAGRPDLERVVVRTGHDAVVAELEACDHVVIVALEHFDGLDVAHAPVHLNVVLSHVAGLPRGVVEAVQVAGLAQVALNSIGRLSKVLQTGLAALFTPQQVVLAQDTPTPTSLGGPQ